MTSESSAHSLDEFAAMYGVTRSYHDGTGQPRRACDEAVAAVLRVLGAPLARADDAAEALRDVRGGGTAADCVTVLEAGRGGEVRIAGLPDRSIEGRLVLESTETLRLPLGRAVDGTATMAVPKETPAGYHRLEIGVAVGVRTHRVLVAPRMLPAAPKGWALFAPLYSLRSGGEERGSFATYGDLARLASWMTRCAPSSGQGRHSAWLGTLPLLACFFEEPFEPSPYSPISRAFWSELYIDPRRAPEFDAQKRCQEHFPAENVPDTFSGRFLDYRAAMRERRAAIETLLANLDARGGRRRDDFEAALEEDDELCRYAAFRACVEREGRTWQEWPAREQGGALRPGSDFDGEAFRYHAYAQWLAREQIAGVARESAAGLYLDLPLGSHGGGYDTWRHAPEYAFGVSAGAPPDAVFEGGQDWGFPPMHPERARTTSYAGLRAALAHHFTHASMLRVDHVMSLHRLFWIPEGFSAADGVYVRYRADELWAVLAIEASRARGGRGAAVVGEDLGTVPDEVRDTMRARGALRMYVAPFEMRGEAHAPLAAPPANSLACFGTHDMEPFAAWWDKVEDRQSDLAALGGAASTDPADALPGLLAWLGASEAQVVCANLEDFWLERERQNLPGTEAAETNWKRGFARETEEFTRDPGVLDCIRALAGANRDTHDVRESGTTAEAVE